jgi:hypothetical protein
LEKTSIPSTWGGEEEEAFDKLKESLKEMLKDARNFRMDRTLPLITETDDYKQAVGAALIEEVMVDGVKERRLIYAASRSLLSLFSPVDGIDEPIHGAGLVSDARVKMSEHHETS